MQKHCNAQSFWVIKSLWNILDKIPRVMKLHLFLLICSIGLVQATNSYAQTVLVNLEARNQTVKDLLNEIENQSGFSFFFNTRHVDLQRKVSVSVQKSDLFKVLETIFAGTDVSYSVLDKKIILSAEAKSSQQAKRGKKISGIVKDENGEPIIGANVIEKGTANGIITNINGEFSLNVSDNAILQISYIGYNSQELNIKGQNELSVNLIEDSKALDEVVIVGYGAVKKRDLTGSVFQVSGEGMKNQAVMNDPIQHLQGKVPGADITVGNAPGENSSISIRGFNSLKASNAPLIVVDDAPFSGRLDEINPSEIEKIDILKDASSTAIYGSRGANGVIIVTTKRANKDKKVSIGYDGYIGVSKSVKNYEMMSAEKYADYKRMTFYGKPDEEVFDAIQLNAIKTGKYVDWQEEMFNGTGYKTDHNITVNQSSDKNRNVIVLGYNKNQSIISNMNYERFSARLNGDLDLSRTIAVGYSALLTRTKKNDGDPNVWRFGSVLDPLTEMYDEKGEMRFYNSGWYSSQLHSNPMFDTDIKNVQNQKLRNKTLLNLFATWNIWNDLKFRTSYTYDFTTEEKGIYYGSNSQQRQLQKPYASNSKSTESQIIFTNLLNYKKTTGKHNMDVSLIQDYQRYIYDNVGLTGEGMPYYGLWYNVSEAPSIFSRSSDRDEWTLFSFMARANYSYMDKYLLTLTGRYDGSSRLAKGNKWDFFPSVALAWRLGEEDFIKSINWISNVKLRLSWGNSGNTAIETYATQGKLGKYMYYFGENEQPATGYIPTELANSSLGWERTEEYNIGLDFGFLNNRISGSVDVYRRNTHDLLMPRNIPITTGYTSTWQNIGKTRNQGIELALNTVPVVTNDFRWTIDATLAYNKNEIVELFNGKEDSPANKWFIGQPFNVEWLYQYAGVWQQSEVEEAKVYGREPGNPKVKDVNGNEKYDQEDLSLYNKIPKWTAGLSTSLYWKNFDFSMYFYSRLNYGSVLSVLTTEAGSVRTNHLNVDFWTPENPTNESPKPRISNSQDLLTTSDYAFRDLSFVRLKNINIGYTLPLSVTQKFLCNKLRVYLMVDNPYIFTKKDYVGLDPENCNSYLDHRPLTSFVFGINAQF